MCQISFGKRKNRDLTTLTHILGDRKRACWSMGIVLLRQYQISLDVVAGPSTLFSSSRELVGAIVDAMEGKTFFAGFSQMIGSLFMLINMPTLTLAFFITVSVQVTS